MKFKIYIDNAERQVEASADGSLVIDGKSYKTQVSGSGSEKRTVKVGDKTYEIRFVDCGDERECSVGEYVLEVAGERVATAVKDLVKEEPQVAMTVAAAPAAAAAPPAAKSAGDYKDGVTAPVPGKILDIKIKAGDSVKEGDVVVVLEAMKMENELLAPKQAVIAAVLVNKGEQVAKDQMLVAFE